MWYAKVFKITSVFPHWLALITTISSTDGSETASMIPLKYSVTLVSHSPTMAEDSELKCLSESANSETVISGGDSKTEKA